MNNTKIVTDFAAFVAISYFGTRCLKGIVGDTLGSLCVDNFWPKLSIWNYDHIIRDEKSNLKINIKEIGLI